METATIHIKNMVCNRCIKVVREELQRIGYSVDEIALGEATIHSDHKIDFNLINKILEDNGFELIDSRQSRIIEKIKITVIEKIKEMAEGKPADFLFSDLLQEKLNLSYQYLSGLFSSSEGITIEKFIILQKIEKVKELIVYDELSLSEIAYRLGYSSVQHLSNQFRKITGLTPSHFKKIKDLKRNPLDRII
ncbi:MULTISPECIES: helix-turn-helix domain-containing protein [Ignavibacterium]|jgi:AraC-like DNA-binding protein|uniref:AraC family transcriptional regulator n=1 Tax=Ignavibacterium TaxID=795750 RepID=UPI0025BAD374|nr:MULTISPECIES: helix-turn-helix domain-containing protein [Ignavibacterium]